jgi:hypothetical protein
MRTEGVKKLVGLALDQVAKPYTEHVIDDVFTVIENVPEFVAEHEALCKQLGRSTVNTWGGYWIARAVGKTGTDQRAARKSKLIRFYSLLDAPGLEPGKKRKEPEALQLMADYYFEHKATLPPHIRDHRGDIVEMIIEGLPVEQVFAMQVDSSVEAPAARRR